MPTQEINFFHKTFFDGGKKWVSLEIIDFAGMVELKIHEDGPPARNLTFNWPIEGFDIVSQANRKIVEAYREFKRRFS